MPHTETSPAGVEINSDDEAALKLRVAGKSFRQIAAAMGCSLSTAHDRVERALAHSKEAMASKGAEYRELEANRLNTLLESIWPSAVGEYQVMPRMDDEGNTRKTIEEATLEGQQKSIDRVLKIMDRRAKMLGLDAPAKTEVTGKNGGPVDLRSLQSAAAEIAAINAAFDAGQGPGRGGSEAGGDDPGDASGDAGAASRGTK